MNTASSAMINRRDSAILSLPVKVPGTKFLDKFLSRKTVPGTFFPAAWMPLFPRQKIATEGGFLPAQGIEAVSFFAGGKKDTSGKPGPRAGLPVDAPGMKKDKKARIFLWKGAEVLAKS
ncbi:MAG: hypothetical protein LBL20_01605 [Treponema sp.]|jgi:hypothetical protein|nr:hypothetical protein [Treponema sp.]